VDPNAIWFTVKAEALVALITFEKEVVVRFLSAITSEIHNSFRGVS